ncbi:MAG: ribokinase [Butyrivibrio sp.]|nr:ribokinase [Butyrivibrio sp.]
MTKKKILVVGSLNMDIVINMKKIPAVGETVEGSGYWHSPGGKGANQCCAAAKLGGNVQMLGCIGNDSYGQILKRSLATAGADVNAIAEAAESTGMAYIFADQDAHNSIVTIKGANACCDCARIDQSRELVKNCDIVLLQNEIPEEAIFHLIEMAYEEHKIIIWNPAPALHKVPDQILSRIDYLTPNETELASMTGQSTAAQEEIIAAGKLLIQKGVRNVVVTAGAAGAVWIRESGQKTVPGIKVNAIDTTGAGDCFNGALAVSIAEGMQTQEAIQKANAASALSVTRKGAQISMPDKAEWEAFYQSIVK